MLERMRTHLDVAREITAPPATAWNALVDTRLWARWGPSVAAVRVDTDASVIEAGTRGHLRARVGPWVPFEVMAFDAGHRWTWRVAGVPATGHRVEPTTDGCRVVFEVPFVAAAYVLVCRRALARIAALVEDGDDAGEPGPV